MFISSTMSLGARVFLLLVPLVTALEEGRGRGCDAKLPFRSKFL